MTNIGGYVGIIRSLTIFLYIDLRFHAVYGTANQEVERHLEMGKKMLAAGQLNDALSHYHAAVDGDPTNYLTYFRRATVFLALGKSRFALPDLDNVLKLRPDFRAARSQRANLYMKQGHTDLATDDYKIILQQEPENVEAMERLQQIPVLNDDKEEATHLYENQQYVETIDMLSKVIEACPWDLQIREMRADSYIATGDYIKAIGDVRATTKLRVDNSGAFHKISKLYYDMGEADESLIQIRECLKLDPDHKECFAHYKKVKKLAKQLQTTLELSNNEQYDECIQKAMTIVQTEPHVFKYQLRSKEHICHCNSKAGHTDIAVKACTEVLDIDTNNMNAFIDRAEAYILAELYEKAIEDFQSAKNIMPDSRRITDGLERAQKLLKMSQKRDYYKILGVKRNAKKATIIKAYRKLAAIWHPDRHMGEKKEAAEKKFLDIAAAKEVLTDPEKRQQYDNGEDPLDPETQANQGGGGPFWQQGFNPFGSGGFQFKFHHN